MPSILLIVTRNKKYSQNYSAVASLWPVSHSIIKEIIPLKIVRLGKERVITFLGVGENHTAVPEVWLLNCHSLLFLGVEGWGGHDNHTAVPELRLFNCSSIVVLPPPPLGTTDEPQFITRMDLGAQYNLQTKRRIQILIGSILVKTNLI